MRFVGIKLFPPLTICAQKRAVHESIRYQLDRVFPASPFLEVKDAE